jgi:hypothetical protein
MSEIKDFLVQQIGGITPAARCIWLL